MRTTVNPDGSITTTDDDAETPQPEAKVVESTEKKPARSRTRAESK